MKITMRLALLSLASINVAVTAQEQWKWLACGKGLNSHYCKENPLQQVLATEPHEVRCCSDVAIQAMPGQSWGKNRGCTNYHESDLRDPNDMSVVKCFDSVTYAEAQTICAANGGYVCTKQQVEDGCTAGGGCLHDMDLVWTGDTAPAPPSNPVQLARVPEDWLWLSCGRGGDCGIGFDVQAQAKEKHEVRCCSKKWKQGWLKSKDSCDVWHESDLLDGNTKIQCFHRATYAEAQQICAQNGGYVCEKEEVESGCVKGSGCYHDNDLVWTSKDAPPGPETPGQETVADDQYMFLACGSGKDKGYCNDDLGVGFANEEHEVRCCSRIKHSDDWLRNPGCKNYHESELVDATGQNAKCYHASTYAEAQSICADNHGYVCTRAEVLDGCAQGSGCSHDKDLVWTSNKAGENEVATYIARRTQAAEITGVCTQAKGRVWGDPHFVSFDGNKYDCQGHGEFVIAMAVGDDPLAIHGRFVRRRKSTAKPTVTESVAIKVHKDVPIVHVTVPENKVNGKCAFTFTLGQEELTPNKPIVEYFQDPAFAGKINVFTNPKNVIFTFPEQGARVQVTAGGSNRCVINTNVCLTPSSHGGADKIVGLLGSPDGNKSNDWMNRDMTTRDIPNNKRDANKKGHEWCMDNWCVGDSDDSLWSPATHAQHNNCNDNASDSFFDTIVDPKVVEACSKTENPEECETDTVAEVEEGGNVEDAVEAIKNDDEEDKLVDNIGENNCEEALKDFDGPVLQDTSNISLNLPEEFTPADPNNFGTAPTTAPAPAPAPTPGFQDVPGDNTQTDSSGSLGDPHFKSWQGEHFEFHGQCDMILAKDHGFAGGLGLEVQIRTKLVRFWSYIKQAVVRIGSDILEIQGSADPEGKNFKYWINLEPSSKAASIGGFPLSIRSNGSHKMTFEIDLSSKFPGQKIVLSTFREFVRVDFKGSTAESFGDAVGMLGDYRTGDLLARNGERKIVEYADLGNEWQLLPSDDMLFHDMAEPQFPKRCILPEDPQGERKRRLSESTLTVEQAEEACGKVLGDELDVKDCVYDVLATQNLDMVGAF